MRFTTVFDKLIQFFKMNHDLVIHLYMLLLIVMVLLLTPPLLVAVFEIDEDLSNGKYTIRN